MILVGFVICVHRQGDYHVYLKYQSTAMFTVHTVTQYVNTITHVSVYTPYRDLCNTHPMRINRNRFDMSAGPCTIHVFPVKSFI